MRSSPLELEARNGTLVLPGGWLGLPVIAALLILFYLLSRINYLLFHALVELFAVAVAAGTFMMAWNSKRFLENGFFVIVGFASLGVAILDIVHALAYKNMGVFPAATANLPTQLWIAGRWLEVGALFAAPFFISSRPHPRSILTVVIAVTALLLASIFWWRIFPDCFIEGSGLTPFKIVSEYLFVLLLAVTILLLLRRRADFDGQVLRLLIWSCYAFIGAELSFTLYTDVFGITNMAGHLFKVAGYYWIYRAVIETGLVRPFDLLFRELTRNEQVLRQRTRELETANASLEIANRDLEAFNYSVSHDLRGPLTAISGRCQILLQDYHARLDPEIKAFIEGIYGANNQMNELITTLLDFARLGTVELQSQPVDVSRVSAMIADRLMAFDPGRQVDFDIAPGCETDADPQLVTIVLENLFGNAWKYSAKHARPRIVFGMDERAGERIFFVRDNGVGFDMAQADKLFEPFRQLHAGQGFEGFGIGLATVKRIVERHGGRIWAEGVPGEGAAFYFTLRNAGRDVVNAETVP
ncbi:MAG: ATP-binding protein [Desulfuromonadales bacterium]|nr:ATP-binding protein [Desulfuromonadales bacterium]